MYMDKQVKRGYNEYIRLDEGIGKDAMMDVALLVMEDGDTWSCEEPEKEVAALVFDGKCTIKWENESYDVDRPNPFDYNPSCLHVCKGVKFEIIAHGPCNIYIQKTLNEKTFPSKGPTANGTAKQSKSTRQYTISPANSDTNSSRPVCTSEKPPITKPTAPKICLKLPAPELLMRTPQTVPA